jgi:Flp pilus assembly protein TadG
MVEFALVFPIILLLTYGIIEFGRMVYIYTSVISAAREAARYGAAVGDNAGGVPYYKDCPGINAAARRSAILTTITVDQIWYDTGPGAAPHISNSCVPAIPIEFGVRIGVHVNAQYRPVIPFLGVPNVSFTAQNARTILVRIPITYP